MFLFSLFIIEFKNQKWKQLLLLLWLAILQLVYGLAIVSIDVQVNKIEKNKKLICFFTFFTVVKQINQYGNHT